MQNCWRQAPVPRLLHLAAAPLRGCAAQCEVPPLPNTLLAQVLARHRARLLLSYLNVLLLLQQLPLLIRLVPTPHL
jgi:hypothetical protein